MPPCSGGLAFDAEATAGAAVVHAWDCRISQKPQDPVAKASGCPEGRPTPAWPHGFARSSQRRLGRFRGMTPRADFYGYQADTTAPAHPPKAAPLPPVEPAAPRVARRAPSPRTVLLVASLGVFMAFVDATIVNIAFPDIASSFQGETV